MAMRLSGMMSGMDTESIVQQLVAARQTKVDNKKKAQTKLEWKQEAWKNLNTKLKNLQQKYISNMRFAASYAKKTTKVSDNNAVNVITGEDAVNGVQNLTIDKLAKTAYMTGADIRNSNLNSDNPALTSMKELGLLGDGESTKISLKIGNSEAKELEVTADSTISDVLNQLKAEGLNANFDAKQGRFFISAKESGKDNNFELKATGDTLSSDVLLGLGLDTNATNEEKKATMVMGQNAQITLNGAKFESNDNVFDINGLTFTALSETHGENVTVTTQMDTDGVYDMVKNFIKEYNDVINEIDKLYNASSAKGYEPLTDDEKEAMSDSEVEKYETKIKDALLRRDDNLSSVGDALKSAMSEGLTVNGKTMYLFDFGISPLSYFTAADNEKNAYHIDGNPDDGNTSGKTDKLKSMIASDPNTVISFFTELSKNLYNKMSDLSKSVDGYRTFGNFYDDKKMKSDYNDYTSKIADMESKLNDYEDKWYKKFSKMETAMAKMQSNTSAVSSLLGGQ